MCDDSVNESANYSSAQNERQKDKQSEMIAKESVPNQKVNKVDRPYTDCTERTDTVSTP